MGREQGLNKCLTYLGSRPEGAKGLGMAGRYLSTQLFIVSNDAAEAEGRCQLVHNVPELLIFRRLHLLYRNSSKQPTYHPLCPPSHCL